MFSAFAFRAFQFCLRLCFACVCVSPAFAFCCVSLRLETAHPSTHPSKPATHNKMHTKSLILQPLRFKRFKRFKRFDDRDFAFAFQAFQFCLRLRFACVCVLIAFCVSPIRLRFFLRFAFQFAFRVSESNRATVGILARGLNRSVSVSGLL